MWRRLLSRGDASRAWQVNKVATAYSAGEHYSMHRVRFSPSKSIFRRTLVFATTAAVCYYVWGSTTFLPLRKLDQKVLEELDKETEEEALEPWFIPFPFTEKKVNPPPYAGSGEEWQAFIEFNADEDRRKHVKNDLRLLVKKAAEKTSTTKMWGNGKTGFQLGPSYLIFTYPPRPPPEFIRWGIEINDEAIEVKTQTVDSRTKALIDRIIMPYPMVSGSYAFAKAMFKQNVDAVTKYLGYTPVNKEFTTATIDPELAKALKKLEARQAAHGGPGSSPSPDSRSPSSASESDSSSHSGDMRANTVGTGRDPSQPGSKNVIPLYSALLGEGSGPWQAFKESFYRAWKPLHCYPPRGSLAVHGIVTLDGPKGRLYIDVWAWYHPKTSEFHKDSLVMRLRSISPRRQLPLRA